MSTKTLWSCPTDWVAQDATLQINYPSVEHPGVEITSTVPGAFKWIFVGLRLPVESPIKTVRVCYQLSSSSSFISQVRLIEMQAPDGVVIRHNDQTDLLSTIPACHASEVGFYRPEGAVTLALRLKFADAADKISIGPLGLDVETGGFDVTNVKSFGAVGDGTAIDTMPIRRAIRAVEEAGGGVVYFPAGVYLTDQPLRVEHDGVTILGAGRDTTVIQNASSDLLHISGEQFIRRFVLEEIQLMSLAGGGHVIVVPKGMGQSTIRAANLFQRNNDKSIYRLIINEGKDPEDESSRGGYNNLVTETWMRGPASPTVPQWYVKVHGNFYNSNTFERVRCDNSGDFFFHLEATQSTVVGNSFRDITFEACIGGKIRLLSCANTLLQACVAYDDLHGDISNDGFYVGRSSPDNNIGSTYTTFINCERRGGRLGDTFKDIRLVPGECLATTVINCGGREGPGIKHDFGDTPVTAIGMSHFVTFEGTAQTHPGFIRRNNDSNLKLSL